MNKADVILDQYYTNPSVAKSLSDYIKTMPWFNSINRIIEPSAGLGSFSDNFPGCIAYDIDPKKDYIQYADFTTLDIKYLKNTLSIGNPPFGNNNKLALEFLNKCCNISDYVAFILPISFVKNSLKNRVSLTHSVVYEELLNNDSFILADGTSYPVKCVFQIWKRGPKRHKTSTKSSCSHFEFCSKYDANMAIRRVGFNAGRTFTDFINVSESSHYFINSKIDINTLQFRFKNINWTAIADMAVGPRSLGKTEIINAYLEYLKNNENN